MRENRTGGGASSGAGHEASYRARTSSSGRRPPEDDDGDSEGGRRSLLSDDQKDDLLVVLIRNAKACGSVCPVLRPSDWAAVSDVHAAIWRAVRSFYRRHGVLPSRVQIVKDIAERRGVDPLLLGDDEMRQARRFLRRAFDDARYGGVDVGKSRSFGLAAIDVCRRFLEERAALRLKADVVRDGWITADLTADITRVARQLDEVRSLGAVTVRPLFSPGWDTEARPQLIETGMTTLDQFFGGGVLGGESYLFMAPYGSCKTTVAVQLAFNLASHAAILTAEKRVPRGKRAVVLFVSTEMDEREAKLRWLSYGARIPGKRLLRMNSLQDLSRAPKPGGSPETEYELHEFARHAKDHFGFIPERDRAAGAEQLANRHLIFLNCTDSNTEDPHVGARGMSGIASWLAAVMRTDRTIHPVAVILDHISALSLRVIAKTGGSFDDRRHIIQMIAHEGSTSIAQRYEVPFFAFHQLSGAANARGTTADIDHTDAAECKAVGEYFNFAVVSNKPTEDHRQLTRWRCTKHRREPPVSYAIVQVDGKFSRVIDRSTEYVVVSRSQQILSKEEATAFGANQEVERRKKPRVGEDDDQVTG